MSRRLEDLRNGMGVWASPLNPLNQRDLRFGAERHNRFFGNNDKAHKAERRRAQDEKFVRDWINKQSELNLDPEQRFDLALKRGDDEDVKLLFENEDDIERFGYRIYTHTFPEPASTVDAKTA